MRRSRVVTRFLVFAVLACIGLARAAEKAPEYQKLRYEEDYRYLRSPDARGDFFDPIKYLPITSDGAAYLSLGGMLRERYEYQSNPLDGPQDRAGVFLQRYLLHADLHLGAHARAFAQLQSALANGRRDRAPWTRTSWIFIRPSSTSRQASERRSR
jgi:hypothetical protein